MTSTARIGRGAFVTLAGAAASLAWAAGAANACETPNPNPSPSHDKSHDNGCTIDKDAVEWAPVDIKGNPIAQFQPASSFQRTTDEPKYGIEVKLKTGDAEGANADEACAPSIDVSLASYNTHGPKWETSGGAQTFVGYSTTKLSMAHDHDVLKVTLPGTAGKPCFGQIDLYFGTTIYDGGTAAGHGPLPNFDKHVSVPTHDELIAAWNGADNVCPATPPVAPPPAVVPPSSSTPSTSPTTHPSTPATTTPTPKATTSTPATPATTPAGPSTPTLAHTGANVGEVSLVALAFFGAGGTAMVAGRRAKAAAGARKH